MAHGSCLEVRVHVQGRSADLHRPGTHLFHHKREQRTKRMKLSIHGSAIEIGN